MIVVLYILHTILAFALVIVVLMQSGKGAGMSGAFGGGGAASSLFGARATGTFLTRATTVLAVTFMVSCLGLTFLGLSSAAKTAKPGEAAPAVGKSVLEQEAAKAKSAPAQSGAPATQPPTGGATPAGQPIQVQPGQSVPVQVSPDGQARPAQGQPPPPPPPQGQPKQGGNPFGK